MELNKRSSLLIFVLIIVVLSVDGLTLSVLYNAAFEQQRNQLEATAHSQATLIEAVAQFDAKFSKEDHTGGAMGATLSQVRAAYQSYGGFGKTGEIVIGKLEDNNIVFLSQSRFESAPNKPQTQQVLAMGSPYAIPMQQALTGNPGTIVARDYRGEMVLAAFEPIDILNYGVIAKIDLSEVREPFIRAGLISVAVALLLIIVGAMLFLRITNPMIKVLKESEAYNRLLFDTSPIGLALCRMDGSLVDINQAYADIVGRGIDETKQLSYWDITPKDFIEEEQRQLESLNATGHYGPFEKEYLHKDGHRVPVSLLGHIIKRDGEKYIWSSVEDISQRKVAEQKLNNAKERLQLLLDSTGEAIYGIDINGNCTFANPACVRAVGYETKEELLGKNMHEVMHHTHPNGSHYPVEECRIYEAHIKGERTHADNEVFWKKDGSHFDVEYWSYPIKREGEIIGSVVTFIDITERKLAEQALLQSEAHLKETQRIAKVGGWELDLLTNELIWSDEIFRIFEIDKKEFTASYEAFLNAIHPQDREIVNKAYSDSLADQKPYEIIHRLQMKDGRIKHVRETCESTFGAEGKPVRSVGTVQDISELHKTEQNLQSAMALNEQVVNASPIGIVIYDENSQCIAANKSVENIIGATHEQVLKQNFRHIPSWKEYGLFDKAEAAIASGERHRGEFELITTFGKHATYDCMFVPFQQHDKQHLLLMIDDISERKTIENALKESETLLEKAQEIARIGHWKLDLVTLEIKGSDELFKLFGFAEGDLTSNDLINVIHEDDRDMAAAVLPRAIESGEDWDIEYRVVHDDGKEIWVHAIGEVIHDEAGIFTQAFGTVHDITERKHAEKEIERIFELSPDMVGTGNMEGYFTRINSSFRHILGYEDEELLAKPFIDFVHEEDVEKTIAVLTDAIEGKNNLTVVNRYKCKDGSFKWVEWNVLAVAQENIFYATGRDITERKQTEAELDKYHHQLEELVEDRTRELQDTQNELVRKERLATLGQLTATVSHELRNPLGAMRPSLYIIDKKSDKSDERVKKAIQRVDRNIDRCDRIIDELLDFTRITELDRHATRIDEWLESVIDEQVIPEGIRVEKDFTLKDVVMTIDTDRLRRAIINVIENACHAMLGDNQKVMNQENSRLHIKTGSNEKRIEIAITDTGNGIPEDILAKIFEPLFSTKGFGVGLGMPTVKQIMQQHGGEIEAKKIKAQR